MLDHVSLRFRSERGEVQALSDISLSVEEGEFVALLGPTGCGKSSLLRLVSDLIPPTSGTIEVRGEPASAARQVNQFGFVFQEPALLSWRTAIGNVRLPLEVVGYPAGAARCPLRGIAGFSRAAQVQGRLSARTVGRHEAAGGDRAGARVEPADSCSWTNHSARSTNSRAGNCRMICLNLWNRERKTVLFVTHNISEAIYLADRVVVMSPHPGRIKTILSPGLRARARRTCTRAPSS